MDARCGPFVQFLEKPLQASAFPFQQARNDVPSRTVTVLLAAAIAAKRSDHVCSRSADRGNIAALTTADWPCSDYARYSPQPVADHLALLPDVAVGARFFADLARCWPVVASPRLPTWEPSVSATTSSPLVTTSASRVMGGEAVT